MTAVHPISHAWISAGSTGAQNYDEFASDAEITEIIASAPYSALGVEMPHCAPESLGQAFADTLPAAAQRLAAAKADGAYTAADDVVGVYRISGGQDGHSFLGMFAMVDTNEISTTADEPGLVIRNEDVFIEKVRERVALLQTIDHLLSPVLLLQTEKADELQMALAKVIEQAGPAPVNDHDQAGRLHEVWPISEPAAVAELTLLAGGGDLVVADGNHRSLAAQTANLDRFLAVVTTPESVQLQPYHRLVASWPEGMGSVTGALSAIGASVVALDTPAEVPQEPGVLHLHTADGGFAVTLPVPQDASGVAALDHALIERLLVNEVLGLDAGDKRIRYIGGDYSAQWLREQVDAGEAVAALLVAPVRVDDFVRVNLEREKMPRKSTWFTPKARGGLVLAQI
ncbi:DUF1015 family protein [Ornithinimicrobium sp. Arc0846-15]|nr:DUF1015 family protein [Ornithinimicrobium laminariae]